MNDLVAEVLLVVLVASAVAGNVALVFHVWWQHKKEKREIEIVDSILGDHDDETTD